MTAIETIRKYLADAVRGKLLAPPETLEELKKRMARAMQDLLMKRQENGSSLRFGLTTSSCEICGVALDEAGNLEDFFPVGRFASGAFVCPDCEKSDPLTLGARIFAARARSSSCPSCGREDGSRKGGNWLHTDGMICLKVALQIPVPVVVFEFRVGSPEGTVYIPEAKA